ncbi:MAG: F0F1 ATP synthase subunit B [Kutzneria sp.]|nr:F0F1 ATP synthase subunit B [Kutzneria sp.]MBV9847509.1 F0F1 ATP synthase subunit B [Kutzneria sp.]
MGEFIADLVGFGVVIAVIWWKVAPPLRKAMRTQQDAIRQQIEQSKAASERLAAAERAYQDAVTEARAEAAKIRDNARADAERIVEEMREQAEREAARIRRRGEEELANQRLQVIHELRAYLGQATLTLASHFVREHLEEAAHQRQAVDSFLGVLEDMAAGNGASERETVLASKGEA